MANPLELNIVAAPTNRTIRNFERNIRQFRSAVARALREPYNTRSGPKSFGEAVRFFNSDGKAQHFINVIPNLQGILNRNNTKLLRGHRIHENRILGSLQALSIPEAKQPAGSRGTYRTEAIQELLFTVAASRLNSFRNLFNGRPDVYRDLLDAYTELFYERSHLTRHPYHTFRSPDFLAAAISVPLPTSLGIESTIVDWEEVLFDGTLIALQSFAKAVKNSDDFTIEEFHRMEHILKQSTVSVSLHFAILENNIPSDERMAKLGSFRPMIPQGTANEPILQQQVIGLFQALYRRFTNSWQPMDDIIIDFRRLEFNFLYDGDANDLAAIIQHFGAGNRRVWSQANKHEYVSNMKSVVTIGSTKTNQCIPIALTVLVHHKDYLSAKMVSINQQDITMATNTWNKIRKPSKNQSYRLKEAKQLFGDLVSNNPVALQELFKFAQVLQSDIVVFENSKNFPLKYHTKSFQLSRKELEAIQAWDSYELALGLESFQEADDPKEDSNEDEKMSSEEYDNLIRRSLILHQKSLFFLLYEAEDNEDVGHVHAITNPATFLGKICSLCGVAYSKIHQKCQKRCTYCYEYNCFQPGSQDVDEWINCNKCNRGFPSQECFDRHSNINCSLFFRCCDPRCSGKVFPTPEANKYKGILQKDHVHGKTMFCMHCKNWNYARHECIIKEKKLKDPVTIVWYADFECFVEPDSYKHIVNFAVAQKVCWMDENGETVPSSEVEDQKIFHNIDQFCHWLLQEENFGMVVVFHNGRSYDFHFIREWMLSNDHSWHFDCIKRGNKMISMTLTASVNGKKKITLLDSISFLTSSLSSLAKQYGVSEKGYFPHRFNIPENFTYVGLIPDVKFFYEDSSEFLQWHQEQVDNQVVWNFKEEIRKYCVQDVNILRLVFERFRKSVFVELKAEVLSCPTLPSLATHVYLGRFYDVKNNQMFSPTEKFTHWSRPAMFGGRTNAIKLKYECTAGESIFYYDVTSLYPFVLVNRYYPLKDPELMDIPIGRKLDVNYYLQRFLAIDKINAGHLCIMDCFVIPPKKLLFPVLPSRKSLELDEVSEKFADVNNIPKDKLLFTLLPQRGKWTNVELKLALDVGYQVKEIYTIAYWTPEKTSSSLFTNYVLYFLKKKTLANGRKKILKLFRKNNNNNLLNWEDYIKSYNSYYLNLCKQQKVPADLLLSINDPVEEERNSADYATWKLFLNSLWGRFCMRNDFYNYSVCQLKDSKQIPHFVNTMTDMEKESQWEFINNNYIEYKTRFSDPLRRPIPKDTNVAIGIFTTSYARAHLWSALNSVGPNVVYHDTDSILFHWKLDDTNRIPLKLGDFLGEWTNEIEDDVTINNFYSAGPKNYAYQDSQGRQYVKCKGFNLKKKFVNAIVNVDLYKKSVDNFVDPEKDNVSAVIEFKVEEVGGVIERTKAGSVASVNRTKTWQCVYSKRLIDNVLPNEITTLPYGYLK